MGLRINELIALADQLSAQRPKSVLTISRLDVFVGLDDVVDVFSRVGLSLPQGFADKYAGGRLFLDQILVAIGVEKVDSVDFSDFEGATLVKDLGVPQVAGDELYDLVYESGTLEHIFNFPVAIRNVLGFCAVGGCVFINTLCNNFCGHGFYQFSPELFYSVVRCSAGFEMGGMEVYEDFDHSPRYSVCNPSVIRRRIEIRSFLPVNMAVKILRGHLAATGIAQEPVLQSDYMVAWDAGSIYKGAQKASPRRGTAAGFRRLLLLWIDLMAPNFARMMIARRRKMLYIGSRREDVVLGE